MKGCFKDSLVRAYTQFAVHAIRHIVRNDRRNAWEIVGTSIPVSRSTWSKWQNERTEIEIGSVLHFITASDFPVRTIPLVSTTKVVREAIARTLTYIRIYPPHPELMPTEERDSTPDVACWSWLNEELGSLKPPFRRPSQLPSILLSSAEKLYPNLSFKIEDVPGLDARMSFPKAGDAMISWFGAWTVFRVATNEYFWLWQRGKPRYEKVWCGHGI